jgi:hypothetical protein
VLPAAAGIVTSGTDLDLTSGFARAMAYSAVLAVIGALIAAVTIRRVVPVVVVSQGPAEPCLPACMRQAEAA